jgi:hypothetical protein
LVFGLSYLIFFRFSFLIGLSKDSNVNGCTLITSSMSTGVITASLSTEFYVFMASSSEIESNVMSFGAQISMKLAILFNLSLCFSSESSALD